MHIFFGTSCESLVISKEKEQTRVEMNVKQRHFQINESQRNSAAGPHYKKCERKFFRIKENGTPKKQEPTPREREGQE